MFAPVLPVASMPTARRSPAPAGLEFGRLPSDSVGLEVTILRTLLLVSAAGIVAVATAQAADLPTRKAAPVEYVRVCNVGGITGWTLPGSNTCVKFSGYVTAQFEGGNLNTQYNWANTSILEGITGIPPLPFGQGLSTQRVLVAASQA